MTQERYRRPSHNKFRNRTKAADRLKAAGIPGSEPADIFFKFLTPRFWTKVVNETNAYAAKIEKKNWVDTTRDELYTFLAIVFVRSIRGPTDVRKLWDTNWIWRSEVAGMLPQWGVGGVVWCAPA